jgi:hypothetical protein
MNGYISFDLDGSVTGLKFAYPAIRMFAEAMAGNDFYYVEGDKGPQMTVEGIAKFIECGYKNNCMIKEVTPELKYEHFYNWVEGAVDDPEKMETINKIMECYAETQYAKQLVAEQEKKSLTGTI